MVARDYVRCTRWAQVNDEQTILWRHYPRELPAQSFALPRIEATAENGVLYGPPGSSHELMDLPVTLRIADIVAHQTPALLDGHLAQPKPGEETSLAHPLLLEQPDFQLDQSGVAQGIANGTVTPHVGVPALDDFNRLASPSL